ncbi:MAG: transporter substrate-binding domain-containing protein [Deltaproteobacteria bacterium]|nr:transporter substrate-binding domain-containing protein [Deltaproteobacteria bacterium]
MEKWLAGCFFASVACAPIVAAPATACTTEERELKYGFYAYFEPVSYSEDRAPGAPGFDVHLGYEADLLTALEAMEGANLSFSRHGIPVWDDLWLLAAGPHYDIVGGGITVLETRTRDATGRAAIVFTSGHIRFRQSLLVRAADVHELARYEDLTATTRVGVLAGTTGEARLLEMTGITDADGVLVAGTRVATWEAVVADGSASYAITAGGATAALEGRQHLWPPADTMPQVVYLADEEALFVALGAGRIDAVAGAEIGNRTGARNGGGAFEVTALDDRAETGGFALAAADERLAACLDRMIDWLTEGGRIGYREWLEDPAVFLRRARTSDGGER